MQLSLVAVNLFFITSLDATLSIRKTETQLRILGGTNGSECRFPYVVILWNDETPVCTAAVLSAHWTLTAAHCVKPVDPDIPIYIGTEKNKVKALNRIWHHRYNNFAYSKRIQYNIAVLNHEELTLKVYGKVSALEFSTLYGREASAAGYGVYRREKDDEGEFVFTESAQLMTMDVLVIKCIDAQTVYPNMCVSTSCKDRQEYKSLCNGDEGGPLIHSSGIVGVATWTYGYCKEHERQGLAGVYTPVSPFIAWIRQQLTTEPAA